MQKAITASAVALMAFVWPDIANAAPDAGCDISGTQYIGQLQEVLSRKAVESVNLAAAASTDFVPELERLVDPSAEFSLGVGDVGGPIGKGTAGLRALVQAMHADTFRYLAWSTIPTPVKNPCAAFTVEVEFIDSSKKVVWPVSFKFDRGRIVEAVTWARWFTTGALTPPRK
jgi:hypothetical protein